MGLLDKLFQKRTGYTKCDEKGVHYQGSNAEGRVIAPDPCEKRSSPGNEFLSEELQRTEADIEGQLRELERQKQILTERSRELSTLRTSGKKQQIIKAIRNASWAVYFIHSQEYSGYWSLSSEPLAAELRKICDSSMRFPNCIDELHVFPELVICANNNYISLRLKNDPDPDDDDENVESILEKAVNLSLAIIKEGLKIDGGDTLKKILHEQDIMNGYKAIMEAGKDGKTA